MKIFFHTYKWVFAWCSFALLLTLFVIGAFEFSDESWHPNYIQTMGIMVSIYPAVLIFLQTRADGDKAIRMQLDHMQELHKNEIEALNKNTNEQINELRRLTAEQINNYSRQTMEVVKRLEDNSVLLAELLVRQLEVEMSELNEKLGKANQQYVDRSGWKFMRTPAERDRELCRWERYMKSLQDKLNYLRSKWQQAKDFLDDGQE